MNEKQLKGTIIAGALVIMSVIIGGLIFGPFNEILPDSLREKLGYTTSETGTITTQLYVDFNAARENVNLTIIFQENETATAYTILLKANLTVQIKEYQQGIYVEGIEGVLQNATHYWWYQIDGQDGVIAANRLNLRSNEVQTVTWLFKHY